MILAKKSNKKYRPKKITRRFHVASTLKSLNLSMKFLTSNSFKTIRSIKHTALWCLSNLVTKLLIFKIIIICFPNKSKIVIKSINRKPIECHNCVPNQVCIYLNAGISLFTISCDLISNEGSLSYSNVNIKTQRAGSSVHSPFSQWANSSTILGPIRRKSLSNAESVICASRRRETWINIRKWSISDRPSTIARTAISLFPKNIISGCILTII